MACTGGLLGSYVVDLHQPHASRAIFAAHNCRVKAGHKIGENGGFTGITWSKPGSRHLGGIIIRRWIRLPIVVHRDHVAVTVSKFEDRISQGVGDTEGRQGGTDRTHHDGGVKTTRRAYNNATNQDVRIRPDEATCAQVTQLTGDRRIVQVINLDQSHTGSTVLATDNGCVETGIQSRDNGGLEGIGRIETVADDPVVLSIQSFVAMMAPVESCNSRTGSARAR